MRFNRSGNLCKFQMSPNLGRMFFLPPGVHFAPVICDDVSRRGKPLPVLSQLQDVNSRERLLRLRTWLSEWDDMAGLDQSLQLRVGKPQPFFNRVFVEDGGVSRRNDGGESVPVTVLCPEAFQIVGERILGHCFL